MYVVRISRLCMELVSLKFLIQTDPRSDSTIPYNLSHDKTIAKLISTLIL